MHSRFAVLVLLVASAAHAEDNYERYQREREYYRRKDDAQQYQRQMEQNRWWADQRVKQMNQRVESAKRMGELNRREQVVPPAPSKQRAAPPGPRCPTLALIGQRMRFAKEYSEVNLDDRGAGDLKVTLHVLDREGALTESIAFQVRLEADKSLGRRLCPPSSRCHTTLIYVRREGARVKAFISVEGHVDELAFASGEMTARFGDVEFQEFDMDRRAVLPNGACLSAPELTLSVTK